MPPRPIGRQRPARIAGSAGAGETIAALAAKMQAARASRPAGADAAAAALTAEADRYLMGLTLWDGVRGREDCPDCRGSGRYRLDIPAGHPRFGKMFACDCRADAMAAERMARLQSIASLQEADLRLGWGSIIESAALAPMVAATKEILARSWGWVYAYGPNGPGKTFVLKVAVAEAVRAGKAAVFVTYADMLNHLRAGFDAGDYEARIEAWRSADILAVDEFARANDTKWAAEAQGLIFNARYERAIAGHKGTTLFSSNFRPDSLEDWFADRLRDSRFRIVSVEGDSMRPLMGDD